MIRPFYTVLYYAHNEVFPAGPYDPEIFNPRRVNPSDCIQMFPAPRRGPTTGISATIVTYLPNDLDAYSVYFLKPEEVASVGCKMPCNYSERHWF